MIANSFAYHKPSSEGLTHITNLREGFSDLYQQIMNGCPASRERSVALTELESAAMWAIKSVVLNDPNSEVEG